MKVLFWPQTKFLMIPIQIIILERVKKFVCLKENYSTNICFCIFCWHVVFYATGAYDMKTETE